MPVAVYKPLSLSFFPGSFPPIRQNSKMFTSKGEARQPQFISLLHLSLAGGRGELVNVSACWFHDLSNGDDSSLTVGSSRVHVLGTEPGRGNHSIHVSSMTRTLRCRAPKAAAYSASQNIYFLPSLLLPSSSPSSLPPFFPSFLPRGGGW